MLYPEFFYRGRGLDIDFDTTLFPADEEAILLGKTKNAVISLALTDADAIVTPTEFQAACCPRCSSPWCG